MLTKNEVTSLSLSPTKKDFVQIWNELLEVAGKLSERWDPTSTNESDPGIVILKALTGIADKLNYNIDKNILEAFMPTAAQEDSMRKLCDMLGYSMKYYRSAVTDVTIKYYNPDPSEEEASAMASGLYIPKFTVITNGDQDISYFTVNQTPFYISATSPTTQPIPCMEGQIVKCESVNDNNVITVNHITENNRFYLPETQIAENGVFVYNIFTSNSADTVLEDGTPWKAVDNLNTQARGTRVFKFGFDSYESRPYIEFPEDYSELFNDGLFIYYTRTSGINGNVSSRTLTQLELPSITGWSNVSTESFSVENINSATTGANVESIQQAYTNFKKTIGTFETLVTCRDYMNKIYSLTKANDKPLVSNILVTDIRNDLNRAVVICSCDDAGIFYKETPLIASTNNISSKLTVGRSEQLTESEYSEPELAEETIEAPTILEEIDSPIEQGEQEIIEELLVASTANKPVYVTPAKYFSYGDWTSGSRYIERYANWCLGSDSGIAVFNDEYSKDLVDSDDFVADAGGLVSEYTDPDECTRSKYWLITQNGKTYTTKLPIDWVRSTKTAQTNVLRKTITQQVTKTEKYKQTKTITNVRVDNYTKEIDTKYAIDHFDLVFYPFKSYNQIKSSVTDVQSTYDASFTYAGNSTLADIKNALEADGIKTIAHNIRTPEDGDILSINNYLRLTATIATNFKVTTEEAKSIKDNIKVALANAFNMRELDFGEEIPFDSIVEIMEKADARIRVASLNEPALYTTFSVLTGKSTGTPTVTEYAVASDWLDADIAKSTGKLDPNSNFNTAEAKAIYNKLAVRNILAGRVSLFNYNNTFKTSFSEGAFKITNKITDKTALPGNLLKPDENNPFTIWTEGDTVYTGQWIALEEKPDELDTEPTESMPYVEAIDTESGIIYTGILKDSVIDENTPDAVDTDSKKPSYAKVMYTKTFTPESFKDNLITGGTTLSGEATDHITDIKAKCELPADQSNTIKDVTLNTGEFVQFRAPNFITTKTYPAYVNYHLDLAGGNEVSSNAEAAEAISLFNLLDSDRTINSGTNCNWQKVLDYFKSVDAVSNTSYRKTFSVQQTISAYRPADESTEDNIEQSEIIINIENTSADASEYSIESLMALSGCVKLVNEDLAATLTWAPENGKEAPAIDVPMPPIKLGFSNANPFITDINLIAAIKEQTQIAISEYKGKVNEESGEPILPTQCAWTISFEFECVPFEAKSLLEWEKFIKLHANDLTNGFMPIEEDSVVFWRKFGEGYTIGKYITADTAKLLKFNDNYFGLLPDTYTKGIYLIKKIGANLKPTIIKNGEEYQLQNKERLYIEYTPSATAGDSTAQELAAITEVYGEGTIFKPSGFEVGITDSLVYKNQGNIESKTVTFATPDGSAQIDMYSLGANEQIEIREPAQVVLERNSFKDSSSIYVYKNFNNCSELEVCKKDENKNRINNSYILKDGEYVFYTDQNKSELAYFTNGTEVILNGDLILPQFDIIELSDIFNDGIQEIPWKMLSLSTTDSIEFQEYQYVTLGANDTLKSLTLTAPDETNCLNADWQPCAKVEYTFAEDPTSVKVLPAINLTDKIGWEANSTLELTVSPDYAQTLRSTPKIATSLELTRTSVTGSGKSIEIVPSPETVSNSVTDSTVSFKTNLACFASGDEISIADVLSNPDKLKGFQLKVFTDDTPSILSTEPGKVVPYRPQTFIDISNWSSDVKLAKESNSLWSRIDMDKVSVATSDGPDNALQLSISLLPNTYGIFCIYVNYSNIGIGTDVQKTWLEVLPGTSHNDITLINSDDIVWENGSRDNNTSDKLLLNPGINCVRVNKNCKVYLKASANTKGTIWFDELQLVNSEVIKYTDSNKGTITRYTQGLNLNQLGYMDATTADDNILNEAARSDLQVAYAEKAMLDMDNAKEQTLNNLTAEHSALVSILPNITRLVETEKNISKDLATLDKQAKTADITRLRSLVDTYNAVNTLLKNENALLTALANSRDTEALEQQLADLLASLELDEVSKQQLLSSWLELRENITSDAAKIQDKVLIDDFNDSIEQQLIDTDTFNIIKKLVSEYVDEFYKNQLADIATELEQVVNSDNATKLLALLRNLHTAEDSEHWADLLIKANELSSLINTDIDSLLENILLYAHTPNYSQLVYVLTQLRNIVDSDRIKILVTELIQAVENHDDRQIGDLVSTLFNEDGTVDLTTITNSSIITAIDDAYTKTKSALVKNPAGDELDNAVTLAVENLQSVISADYNRNLRSIFTAIKDLLNKISIDTDISIILNKLEGSNDDQVGIIIKQLNDLLDKYSLLLYGQGSLKGLNAFTNFDDWSDNTCASFIKEAVIQVWPEFTLSRLTTLLDNMESLFNNTINGKMDFSNGKTALTKILKAQYTTAIQQIMPVESVSELFNKIEPVLSVNNQKIADASTIDRISTLMPVSEELTNAIALNTSGNAVISTLLAEYTAAENVIRKQKILAELKDALDSTIDVNEQLLNIVSNILFPSIAAFELNNNITEDAFYKNLLTAVNKLKTSILNKNFSGLSIIIDDTYEALLEDSDISFNDKLTEFKIQESLLPKYVLDSISELKKELANYIAVCNAIEVFGSKSISTMTSSEIKQTALSIANLPQIIKSLVDTLYAEIYELEQQEVINTDYVEAYKILRLEEQLLADIRAVDTNREFYYNVPIDDSLAIEFNESSREFNTLLNPRVNYDINNVNNSFVISKLDIDYLTQGIQIARSSRYN